MNPKFTIQPICDQFKVWKLSTYGNNSSICFFSSMELALSNIKQQNGEYVEWNKTALNKDKVRIEI